MFFAFIAAGFGLLALAHVAPFPFLLDAIAPARSVWKMTPRATAPTVYLTFDDGPNPRVTPDLLDVLARHGAVATFFLIDRHITDDTAPLVQRIFEEGHAVGIHTHSRAPMVMPPESFARMLRAAADRVEDVAGQRPCRVFRPHGGWRSGQMYEGLALADYALVGWGWGLWDFNWYRPPDVDALVERIVNRASNGDIVVLHDGHHIDARADRQHTVEAVERIVPALRERGFTLGTLCGESSDGARSMLSDPRDTG